MNSLFDILFRQTWWSWERDRSLWYSTGYHWFNLFEGCVWLGFAYLVFRRYRIHKHSRIELWYALAFFTFGLTDFREAWFQQSWLIWLKGVNLIVLLLLRRRILREFYPESKVF